MAPPELVHFTFSHFNEKARWALDYKAIPHKRRAILPGPHLVIAKRLSGQFQVPILIDGTRVIHDSSAIIAWLDDKWPERPLIPSDPAERERALALEEFFDTKLGPHIRRAAYFDLLPDTDLIMDIYRTEQSRATMAIYRVGFPLLREAMVRSMRIYPDKSAQSRERVAEALDRIEAELQPSGFLVGERFSVADLSAVALLLPILDNTLLQYPYPTNRPPRWEEWTASLEGHPALVWANGIYRAHRGRSAEVR